MKKSFKLAIVGKDCVACGCCITVCPRDSIQIEFGISARIDSEKCVGCGKCAAICPAAVINLVQREELS